MSLEKYLSSFKNALLKSPVVKRYPAHIYIEPSTACNISCVMCDRAKLIKDPKFITFDKFKAIIDEVKPLHVGFSGYGETLIVPDFFKMISYATERGIEMIVTTNGVRLGDNIKNIIDSGLQTLYISLDAATEETYKQIRRNDNFVNILKNIKLLSQSRQDKRPYMELEFVLMGKNKHEVLDFIKLAKEVGADGIRFQMYTQVDVDQKKTLSEGLSPEELESLFISGQKLAVAFGVKTNFDDLFSRLGELKINYKNSTVNSKKICVMPWVTMNITVDGDVWPCCQLMTRDCIMGNINNESIAEVWNGQKMQDFRKKIRQGMKPHLLCQMCSPQSVGDIVKNNLIRLKRKLFKE